MQTIQTNAPRVRRGSLGGFGVFWVWVGRAPGYWAGTLGGIGLMVGRLDVS